MEPSDNLQDFNIKYNSIIFTQKTHSLYYFSYAVLKSPKNVISFAINGSNAAILH